MQWVPFSYRFLYECKSGDKVINYYNRRDVKVSLLLQMKQFFKKNRLAKKQKVYISEDVDFLNTSFQGNNKVFMGVDIHGALLGYGTYVGMRCYLPNVKIGKFSSIAPDVQVITGNHPVDKYISTHPAFYSTLAGGNFTYVKQNYYYPFCYVGRDHKFVAVIGNDVWIGKNVLIMEGVTIGDGAIVGAGALVLKDIPPYCVYAGVPAHFIKKRFTDAEIEKLMLIKWWNKSTNWIERNSPLFREKNAFFNKCEQEIL